MTKRILIVSILVSLNTISYAGGGRTSKKPESTPQKKEPIAWVPEKNNVYKFQLVNNTDYLTVVINGSIQNQYILSIIDLNGSEQFRRILAPMEGQYALDVKIDDLKHGVYFVKIDSEDEIRLKRLVMQ